MPPGFEVVQPIQNNVKAFEKVDPILCLLDVCLESPISGTLNPASFQHQRRRKHAVYVATSQIWESITWCAVIRADGLNCCTACAATEALLLPTCRLRNRNCLLRLLVSMVSMSI